MNCRQITRWEFSQTYHRVGNVNLRGHGGKVAEEAPEHGAEARAKETESDCRRAERNKREKEINCKQTKK
jgi:hypothetical protein